MKEKTIERIIFALKKQNEPITLRKLSNITQLSYPTVLKYADVMDAKGQIIIKNYGNVRLTRWKK